MEKQQPAKAGLVFPRFQQPQRIGLLIIGKMSFCKAAHIFPLINNLMMINFLFMK
jgi:hypothetical protein